MRSFSLLLLASAAWAQSQPGILLRQTFTGDTSGWMARGQGGSVRAAAGTLEFDYQVRPNQLAMALLPAPPETARLQRLRLRLKTDHDTAVAVLLSEKKPGGGSYVANFWAPSGAWQTVELAPADFAAADGPNDPIDSNGRLDLDQVEGIAIIDLASFFAALPENPDFPVMRIPASGSHTLQLGEFTMLSGDPVPAPAALSIDHFDRGFLQWMTPGGMKLKIAGSENPLHEAAMEVNYEQAQGHFGLLLRRLANVDLARATGIAFDIASRTDTTVVVSLELKDGKRFHQTIYPPAEREVFHVQLKFSDFEGNGKLDPTQLKSILLADVSAADGGGSANTLWLGKVEGVR